MSEQTPDTKTPIGEQGKRAVVTIGRFNPPTRGHYKVIDAMKRFIRENKDLNLDATSILVIVDGKETGKDKTRNPLSAEDRKRFMENSGHLSGVKVLIAGSAFAAFEEVRKAGYEPIVIAAGDDRRENYLKMLNRYFKANDGSAIKHYSVPDLSRDHDAVEEDNEDAYYMITQMIKDGEEIEDSQISGSLARYAASQGDEKAFAYVVGLNKKPVLAKKMMDKIIAATKEQDGVLQ